MRSWYSGLTKPTHGRDAKARDHDVIGQVAGELHQLGSQADLLVSLAQCRVPRIGILRLDAAAGKADLAGMILERRGALREQHGQAASRAPPAAPAPPPACGASAASRAPARPRSGGAPASHCMSSSRRRRPRIERLADVRFGVKRILIIKLREPRP